MISWFAEQVRKLYDVVPVDLRIDAGTNGVLHLKVIDTQPGTQSELSTRFRARADSQGGGEPVVTATLTVGPVARVRELLDITVIDDDAMCRLADQQLQQAFPAAAPTPTHKDLDAIGLFDPTIGHGWVVSRTASAASATRPW